MGYMNFGPNRKLKTPTADQQRRIREMVAEGFSNKAIAERFGVHNKSIRRYRVENHDELNKRKHKAPLS